MNKRGLDEFVLIKLDIAQTNDRLFIDVFLNSIAAISIQNLNNAYYKSGKNIRYIISVPVLLVC